MNSGASLVKIHTRLFYMRCAIHLGMKSNSYMRMEVHIEPRNTPPFDHVAGTPSHDSNITKSRLMASHTCTAFVVAHQVVVLVGKSPCSITRESNDRSRFRMGTRGDNPRIYCTNHGDSISSCRGRVPRTKILYTLRNEQRRKSLVTYVIYSVHTPTAVESRNTQVTAC